MTHFYRLLAFMFLSFPMIGQADLNIEMVSFTAFNEAGNDVWGYVDSTGIEYAIVGSSRFTRIFSLENPAEPVEVAQIQGSQSVWRDFKTFGTYIYVSTDEGSDGITIIDMSDPKNITSTSWRPELTNGTETAVLSVCHNLYVDENGIGYLAGCNFQNGVIIVDFATDPLNPSILSYVTTAYSHDVFVRSDTLYTSDIFDGVFRIYDVNDKTNPVLLASAETTSLFTHNAWTNDDGTLLFTTDEVGDAFVDSYDISDLTNIKRLNAFQPLETADQGVIPHNTHFMDDYLITSWYTDGIVITDVSSPDNMVKVGGFDTFLGPDGGFNGCWGAYPWLPSGLILASNITNSGNDNNGGLYVLRPTYERAAKLEGRITDISTGAAINMAEANLLSSIPTTSNSDPAGVFKTGVAETGLFDLVVTHPDYLPLTVSVFLENGQTEMVDIEMEPKTAGTLSGSVVRLSDGSVVPNANIVIFNEENRFAGQADENGVFDLDLFQGTYTAVVGAWGFLHSSTEIVIEESSNLVIELERGYQDDFIFDLGWIENGNAQTGAWELGEPNGTSNQGTPSNPDVDESDDLGAQAYITGNAGGEWFEDDVDNGTTTITSPAMDLSTYLDPYINFSYWFFNAGGNSAPNDNLIVSISNGTEAVDIFEQNVSNPNWVKLENIQLNALIDITSSMTISVTTSDLMNSGHIVEAGFDAFLVTDDLFNSTEEENLVISPSIQPNPFNNEFVLNWESNKEATLFLIDNSGKEVGTYDLIFGTNRIQISDDLVSGIYHAKIVSSENTVSVQKLIKI